MNEKEIQQAIDEIRSLKALKEETENALKETENKVIKYLKDKGVNELIGSDFKASYKEQSRESLDKVKLLDVLGDLTNFTKVTKYSVLRIK